MFGRKFHWISFAPTKAIRQLHNSSIRAMRHFGAGVAAAC